MFKGPYACDMRLSDNETVPWVNFFVKPSDKNAICSVEDHVVDPLTNLSVYFRIPLGGTERFRIRCRTENNPVDETYVVDVRRPLIGLSTIKANRIGKLFAWLSTMFSSHRGHIFLHNSFMHRWISTTGRGNVAESYRSFARAFHPFNLFPPRASFVKFSGYDWTSEIDSKVTHLNLAAGTQDIDLEDKNTHSNDRRDVLINWEAEYQDAENILDYVWNIVVSIGIIILISVSYIVVWFTVLSKNKNNVLKIRRSFPKWLHPSRFWTFILDFATISWLTSGLGLLMSKKNYDLRVLNIATTSKKIGILSIGLLITGPICFFLYAACVLASIQGQVLYSKSLNNYHDRKVQYARAMDRYAFGIPILDAFCSWEVSKVMPICRRLEDSLGKDKNEIKKAFKSDDRTRNTLEFHTENRPMPQPFAHDPRGAYTAACEHNDNIDSQLLGDAKYKRFVGLGTSEHAAAKRYRGVSDADGGEQSILLFS